jgi:hypothetical protein
VRRFTHIHCIVKFDLTPSLPLASRQQNNRFLKIADHFVELPNAAVEELILVRYYEG